MVSICSVIGLALVGVAAVLTVGEGGVEELGGLKPLISGEGREGREERGVVVQAGAAGAMTAPAGDSDEDREGGVRSGKQVRGV